MRRDKYQLLPPLSKPEFEALKGDIRSRGVLVPVEKDEAGDTLDGHHRIRAWEELRAEGLSVPDYPVFIRTGLSGAEKRQYVRSINLQRRHLSTKQRREIIAAQLRETPTWSDRRIAGVLAVDHKTVAVVRRLLVSNGEIPQCTRTTIDGRSYPSARKPAVLAMNRREERESILLLSEMDPDALPGKCVNFKRLGRIHRDSQPRKTLKASGRDAGTIRVRSGDFRNALGDVADSSVDLVLTDPPFAQRFLPLWNDLGSFAHRVLRAGGFLVAYSGQLYLPTVLHSLVSAGLQYVWTIAQLGSGPRTAVHAACVNSAWKPVLVFCKPPFRQSSWFTDVIDGRGPEKALHKWQQAEDEAVRLVEVFSRENSLVVDPFLGSGTVAVAVASAGSGRRFVGAESDPKALSIARKRLTNCGGN